MSALVVLVVTKEDKNMFKNYGQIWAQSFVAIAGFVVIIGRSFGWDISETDVVFALGALANAGGVIWAVVSLFTKEKKLGALRRQVESLGGSILD